MSRASVLAGLLAGSLTACGPSVDGTGNTTSSTASTSSSTSSSSSSTSTEDTSTGEATTSFTPTSSGSSGGADATSGGSTGSPDPVVCSAAALIELKDPSATPDMGPTWGPGEGVMIGVTLHNPGPEDFLTYPGVRVVADHPGVTARMPETYLFALLVGQDNPLAISFTAAPDVPAPAVVNFTIEVTVLNEGCLGLMQVVLPVDLQ
jgi:hypothetical protein